MDIKRKVVGRYEIAVGDDGFMSSSPVFAGETAYSVESRAARLLGAYENIEGNEDRCSIEWYKYTDTDLVQVGCADEVLS